MAGNWKMLWSALLLTLLCAVNAQTDSLLGLFGLNTGNAGTVDRMPLSDIASQSVGLLNYIQSVQRNPDNNLQKKLKEPLPQVTLIDGLPAVPGIVGSLPGAGGCLPKQTPLVNQRSPSIFQNFVRLIPGAQDYLASLIRNPEIDLKALLGKFQWVVSTAGVHDRYCPTTEFKNLVKERNTSSVTTMDSFHESGPQGAAKVGFGYALQHNDRVYIYFQEDPCPYQIVMTGPKHAASGQYEYVVLSNWAKFPIIAMARDVEDFNKNFRGELVERFKKEGFIHDLSDLVGNSVHFVDWSQCRPLTPVGFISNVLNRFLFG